MRIGTKKVDPPVHRLSRKGIKRIGYKAGSLLQIFVVFCLFSNVAKHQKENYHVAKTWAERGSFVEMEYRELSSFDSTEEELIKHPSMIIIIICLPKKNKIIVFPSSKKKNASSDTKYKTHEWMGCLKHWKWKTLFWYTHLYAQIASNQLFRTPNEYNAFMFFIFYEIFQTASFVIQQFTVYKMMQVPLNRKREIVAAVHFRLAPCMFCDLNEWRSIWEHLWTCEFMGS